jgi:hypothetical protein
MSWMEVLSIAGTGLFVGLPGLTLPFLAIYLVHDFLGRRQGNRDPMLGSKLLTTMGMTLAGQLVLAGLAVIAASMGESSPEGWIKTGAGLVLAGAVIGAFPTYLYLARVHRVGGARIGHQALGLNALAVSLAFAVLVIIASQGLFHDEDVIQPAAAGLIYGLAMLGTGIGLVRSSRALP